VGILFIHGGGGCFGFVPGGWLWFILGVLSV
jgi:hypothetical protein